MRRYPARRPGSGGRSTVFGSKGAVACEHPLAALTGIRTLENGGNSADACVAMAASLAVLAPMMTGMGGDAFLLFYESETGYVRGMDGSGRAPRSATIEELRSRGIRTIPERGGLTITVPGTVRLWEDAANTLGNLPLARLLEPAWELAEEGYPVSELVARYWEVSEALLLGDEAARVTFLPEGRAPTPGELFYQEDLARTLAAVAGGGADAFYTGEISGSIVRSVQEAGGYLDEEDLANHETLWVEPIHTDYRGIRVYEIPPPGQGIAALQMLNLLEGFDLASLDALGAERIHLEAEAKKLAFRDLHEKVGDPEFEKIPIMELISKDYAARLRENISSTRTAGSAPEPALGNDTVYLCAVDVEGNACSFINSLYKWFGSGIVAPGTGVCLQNRGHSFRLDEGHPNALAPGKRPLHTIIPGLATRDGALWAVFGVMGGSMQPQGHTQLLANLIDFDMSPQEAVDHPRHRYEGERLLVEGRVPETEVEKLRALGHWVEVGEDYAIPTGGAQLICVLKNGARACGSDPRKDGCALAE